MCLVVDDYCYCCKNFICNREFEYCLQFDSCYISDMEMVYDELCEDCYQKGCPTRNGFDTEYCNSYSEEEGDSSSSDSD